MSRYLPGISGHVPGWPCEPSRRPYLEAACLAQLAFASKIGPFARTRRLCREAIALAERHGWDTEPIIAPALVTLAAALIWAGELDEGKELLQRTARALEADSGPGIRLLLHLATGMLYAGHSRHHEALAEFSTAERLQAELAGSHAHICWPGWPIVTSGISSRRARRPSAPWPSRNRTGWSCPSRS